MFFGKHSFRDEQLGEAILLGHSMMTVIHCEIVLLLLICLVPRICHSISGYSRE